MSEPSLVEIIAYAPTAFYHCTHCEIAWREMGKSDLVHQEQLSSSLPPDLAQEYARVSSWVRAMFERYCDQIVIKVIDAASIEGFYKSMRYRVRRYPAVIVDRQERFVGGNLDGAGEEIERRIRQRLAVSS